MTIQKTQQATHTPYCEWQHKTLSMVGETLYDLAIGIIALVGSPFSTYASSSRDYHFARCCDHLHATALFRDSLIDFQMNRPSADYDRTDPSFQAWMTQLNVSANELAANPYVGTCVGMSLDWIVETLASSESDLKKLGVTVARTLPETANNRACFWQEAHQQLLANWRANLSLKEKFDLLKLNAEEKLIHDAQASAAQLNKILSTVGYKITKKYLCVEQEINQLSQTVEEGTYLVQIIPTKNKIGMGHAIAITIKGNQALVYNSAFGIGLFPKTSLNAVLVGLGKDTFGHTNNAFSCLRIEKQESP